MTFPKRGEVWLVEFDPARGAEIRKTRPAVIVSREDYGRLPLRMAVPITGWKEKYEDYPWLVRLEANARHGLTKTSGADAFQCRSLTIERFERKLGLVTASELKEIIEAVAICIGFQE